MSAIEAHDELDAPNVERGATVSSLVASVPDADGGPETVAVAVIGPSFRPDTSTKARTGVSIASAPIGTVLWVCPSVTSRMISAVALGPRWVTSIGTAPRSS